MTTPNPHASPADRLASAIRRGSQAILDGDEKRAARLQAWLNRHLHRQERFHDALDRVRDRREARVNNAIERMTNPFRRRSPNA